MDRIIIFGCGNKGEGSYEKLHGLFEIVAWTDNNSSLWGKTKFGIPILSPDEMYEVKKETDVIIIVAVIQSEDIITQLNSNGIYDYYTWKEGFFFFSEIKGFLTNMHQIDRLRIQEKSALFVMYSVVGSIREYRLAIVLKRLGFSIYLACFAPPYEKFGDGFADVYEAVIPIMCLEDLMKLANEYSFEFIHSSSEPEWATAFLTNSNKCVIHECHDLGSANVNMTIDYLLMEYISNKCANGVIYPSEALRQEAVSKFSIPTEKTLVMENLISESLKPVKRIKKISKTDGKIHAVYEGAITEKDENDKRFFEKIWIRLAEEGIVVHFYSNHSRSYCEYLDSLHMNIHYEGNISSKQLATEMTKYDVGLLIFNVNKRNKKYIEDASPNKMYEYINSGLPVATHGVDSHNSFVKKHHVGREIYFEDNLYSQFEDLSKMNISPSFLKDNNLSIESHISEITEFISCVLREK